MGNAPPPVEQRFRTVVQQVGEHFPPHLLMAWVFSPRVQHGIPGRPAETIENDAVFTETIENDIVFDRFSIVFDRLGVVFD